MNLICAVVLPPVLLIALGNLISLQPFFSSSVMNSPFHVEATRDPAGVAAAARVHGLSVGVAFNPQTSPAAAADVARSAGADIVLCMSIHPGYSGQAFMPDALDRIAEVRRLVDVPVQVDGGVGETNARAIHEAGASLLVCGSAIFADADPAAAYRRILAAAS